MPKRPEDRYSNLASVSTLMSAANVLTFSELVTGISLGQGMGMLIDQIDYLRPTAGLLEMTAAGDAILGAWCTSNAVPGISSMADRRIIHQSSLVRMDFGTAASGEALNPIQVAQFFPPLIVAAPRLFFGVNSSGLASAATMQSRLYFRYVELTSQEYLELAETFLLVG